MEMCEPWWANGGRHDLQWFQFFKSKTKESEAGDSIENLTSLEAQGVEMVLGIFVLF